MAEDRTGRDGLVGTPRLTAGLTRCGGAIVAQHGASEGRPVEIGCEQCGDSVTGIAREGLAAGAEVGRCGRIVGIV